MTGSEPVEPIGVTRATTRPGAADHPLTRRDLAYLVLVLFVGLVIIGVGGYSYTNYVDDQRVAGEKAATAERARQGEVTRRIVCDMVNAQVEVFTNPAGPVAAKALAAWQALSVQFQCVGR